MVLKLTDEIIEERLDHLGFGHKQYNDVKQALNSVKNHYNLKFTNDSSEKADFYIYEESTADGYSLYIATNDTNSIDINYDVYYYDSELGTVLEEHIKSSNLVKDNQNKIFISDLDASFIEDALFQLFVNLQFEFEEIVINKLLEEGYRE
jgi:hypothetical protein